MTGEGLVAASSCEQACTAPGAPVGEGDKQICESVGIVRGKPRKQRRPAPQQKCSADKTEKANWLLDAAD